MDLIEGVIKNKLSEKRLIHTLAVRDTALALAERWGANKEKTEVAALLHDYAKELKSEELIKIAQNNNLIASSFDLLQPQVLHGPVGSFLINKELNIQDREVLNAVASHTLGREEMSLLDKIIFIADMIEPGRSFQGVDKLRELVKHDLDEALIVAFDSTILFLITRNEIIHPQTIISRNSLLSGK